MEQTAWLAQIGQDRTSIRSAERSRTLEEWVPPEIRRNSREGGRCIGGIGGCYWGGGHY